MWKCSNWQQTDGQTLLLSLVPRPPTQPGNEVIHTCTYMIAMKHSSPVPKPCRLQYWWNLAKGLGTTVLLAIIQEFVCAQWNTSVVPFCDILATLVGIVDGSHECLIKPLPEGHSEGIPAVVTHTYTVKPKYYCVGMMESLTGTCKKHIKWYS